MNIAQAKKMADDDQAAIDQFLADHGPVAVIATNVSRGMKKTDYLPRAVGGFATGREAAAKLQTGDTKFDMYANALPSELRQWVAATGQDVRAMYKEYRALKKEGLVAKYIEAVQTWVASQ